ncbi:MAG: 30S ribosomal protein S9 [Spirochaetia bacterium]|nr:30S ribosomal protein S9 [Spirochaetia bacterium]
MTEKKQEKPEAKKSKKGTFAVLYTGRRKTSVARVRVIKGTGIIKVNKKPIEEYFGRLTHRFKVLEPLKLTGTENNYDIFANVKGGGNTGQADAICLGISRFLDSEDAKFHKELRKNGLLTRDSRMVERKKYGLHKARRATQFSKR